MLCFGTRTRRDKVNRTLPITGSNLRSHRTGVATASVGLVAARIVGSFPPAANCRDLAGLSIDGYILLHALGLITSLKAHGRVLVGGSTTYHFNHICFVPLSCSARAAHASSTSYQELLLTQPLHQADQGTTGTAHTSGWLGPVLRSAASSPRKRWSHSHSHRTRPSDLQGTPAHAAEKRDAVAQPPTRAQRHVQRILVSASLHLRARIDCKSPRGK
ncbi:hypothetical protein LIA77_03310 [Sarocladium implicatum]|nr:hypothetical protein LIA77_03310 [Sarocladium implicatum]